MAYRPKSLVERIIDIDEADLQYVERDLCYYELVSLGFLMYGRERTQSEFLLQKLLVLSKNPPRGRGILVGPHGAVQSGYDILQKYATINPNTWRVNIIEALAIIRAKRVLRKLGFRWQELQDHYLPHIPELSIHIHPLLKALYKICERLTIAQAGRLVMKINETHLQQESQNFRFYDYSQLEVFLLYWITQRLINVGDQNLVGLDVQVLLTYLKLNEMDNIKTILTETINHKTQHGEKILNIPTTSTEQNYARASHGNKTNKDSGVVMESLEMISEERPQGNITEAIAAEENGHPERYAIRRQHAGFAVIINQSEFYEDDDPELKEFLPEQKFNKFRAGTDVDRDKLKELFSSFGYTALVFNNLTHTKLLHAIRETVDRSILRDSLVVCILSHGMEGVVFGCNSVPVSINSIKSIMTADSLKGKPKILIIQACQKNIARVDTSVSNFEGDFNPDAYADMLVAMSSVPGTEAIRDTKTGSWFIESLCKLTDKFCDRHHLSDILISVGAEVSRKQGGKSDNMLPYTHSTLRKYLYLPHRPS